MGGGEGGRVVGGLTTGLQGDTHSHTALARTHTIYTLSVGLLVPVAGLLLYK